MALPETWLGEARKSNATVRLWSDRARSFEATLRELDAVFARNGVTRIAAKGQPLDPNRHQAMIEIPSDDVEPGTIVEEMQPGYMLKDRLLRPALVGVARKP